MSERKIFAGPRIRRIRNERGLTQTSMAEALGISPSYLNLIERNQRPLTVQLLLKLASVYKLDLDSLQAESGTTVARTLEGPQGAFSERPRRTAILLGCSLDAGSETIYGANSAPRTEIGPACRLCERQGCITRAEPPLTRPLGLDEMVAGLSAFDFQ